MTVRLKHVYIFFLLIIVSLLIFIVQGISQQGTTSTKENDLIHAYMGFDGLVIIQTDYLYIGFAIAVCVGLLTSFFASMKISGMNAAELLRGV